MAYMIRENNEDTFTGGGISTEFDFEVGFMAMIGVHTETDVHFGVSVSNNASLFRQCFYYKTNLY